VCTASMISPLNMSIEGRVHVPLGVRRTGQIGVAENRGRLRGNRDIMEEWVWSPHELDVV